MSEPGPRFQSAILVYVILQLSCVAVQNFIACGGQDQRRQISARHVDVHRVHIYVACI